MVEDALCRLNLPLAGLRGMAFDGAANMSGRINGDQAILRRKQPAALFVHYGAHCVNLVAKDSCDAAESVRKALGCVNELGAVFSDSGKLRAKFKDVCNEAELPSRSLRPLCPTRWTARLAAVDAALSRYPETLTTLENLAEGGSHLSTRAAGLHAQMLKGQTMVAIQMARAVLAPMDRLSRAVQSTTCTVSAMMQCIHATVEQLRAQRESADETVREFLKQAQEVGCEEVQLPRKWCRPERSNGDAPTHHPASVEDYLRAEYFVILDMACVQ